MNATNTNSEKIRLWRKIGEDFRQACLLRRDGKGTEAAAILDQKLPETIAAWGRVAGLKDAERREQLDRLFKTEQKRVEDIWLSQQIVLRQMRDIVIPSLCLQVAEEVREVMELQVEQISRMLAAITKSQQAAIAASPAPARQVPPRVIPEPNRLTTPAIAKPAAPSRPTPDFDDLPAIIDQLISYEFNHGEPDYHSAALV